MIPSLIVAVAAIAALLWALTEQRAEHDKRERLEQELGFRDTRERHYETIIAQNCEVQDAQRAHIEQLQHYVNEFPAEISKQIEISNARAVEVIQERQRNEQLRKEFAGDLQLERQRFDDFVRDMMDKVIAPPATEPRPRSSSAERQLPPVIQQAIEDTADGSAPMEQHLEREAWRRLKSDNSNAAEIAEAIRKGETPE